MAPGGGWDEAVAKNLEAGFTTIRPITLKVLPLHLGSAGWNHSEEFQTSSTVPMA